MKDLLIGGWINTCSPVVAEIMSASGFDFLVVDAEHSAIDVPQAQSIFQAIKAGNPSCMPMVRLAGNTYAETKRYLDAGAMGVIAPLINSKTEAKELVRSVKYPPLGDRSVGYGRSHGYGFSFDEYMHAANEKTFVCIQIEHIRAVENLDEILSVEGINAALVGPYDLTASMGITAQFENRDYISARDHILKKCKEYGVIAGIHVVQPNPAEACERIKQGFKMIGYSLDITMIGTVCRLGLNSIKKGLKNDSQ
ncbi:MAG: HpcH/HpaI aldolase/citrate lyase family protein [bacterium]